MNGKVFLQVIQGILQEAGFSLSEHANILDFGCGNGNTVDLFRKQGYAAYGVDIVSDASWQSYDDPSVYSVLEMDHYHFPFADNTFDLIISWMVFEHVQNYSQAIVELYRVLKPGGLCLHIFPSRYRLIEAHVFVPLAGFFRWYPWLALWALLGIRNSYQQGLPWQETARTNAHYLKTSTNYLSRQQITQEVKAHFDHAYFAEALFFKHTLGKARLLRYFPQLAKLYSTFWTRIVLFIKK